MIFLQSTTPTGLQFGGTESRNDRSPTPSAGLGALESTADARCPVQGPTAGTLDLWKSADAETGGRNSSATCPRDTITEQGDRTHGCLSQACASPSQCGKDRQGLKRVWVFMAECKTCEWQGSRPHPQSPCPRKHGALAVGALHPFCDSLASTSVSRWPQFLGIHMKAASSLARLPEAAPDHPLPTQQRHGPWPYPHIPQPQIQAWEGPPKCQASGFDHKLAGPQTQAPSQGGTNRTPGLWSLWGETGPLNGAGPQALGGGDSHPLWELSQAVGKECGRSFDLGFTGNRLCYFG